jgi:hypothetical protein
MKSQKPSSHLRAPPPIVGAVTVIDPTRFFTSSSFAWLMNHTPSPSDVSAPTRSLNSVVTASQPLPYSRSDGCAAPRSRITLSWQNFRSSSTVSIAMILYFSSPPSSRA